MRFNTLNNMIETYEYDVKNYAVINHELFMAYREFTKSLKQLRELLKRDMRYYNQLDLFANSNLEIQIK